MLIQYKINKIDKVSEVTNAIKVAKEKSIDDARKLINDKSTAYPKKLKVLYPSNPNCEINQSISKSPKLQNSDNKPANFKWLTSNFKNNTQAIITVPVTPQYPYLVECCTFAK